MTSEEFALFQGDVLPGENLLLARLVSVVRSRTCCAQLFLCQNTAQNEMLLDAIAPISAQGYRPKLPMM